jgi:hypothetical protein
MKKLYILSVLGLTLFAGDVMAQSQRLVLVEEFTQASCGPCASQNPALNAMLANNSTKVVSVKYQTDWPGVDPMNVQTQSWVGPRVSYYGVTGVPNVRGDGNSTSGAPGAITQNWINTRYATAAPFDLDVNHTFSADYDSIFVEVLINCTQAVTGNLVLQVAMVEEDITFCQAPGTNGETEFFSVMRKMFPNASGTTLGNSWAVGQTQTLTFSGTVPAYIYDLKQVAIIGFIQDNANKAVHQAGISDPLPIALDASLKNCNQASASVTCGTSYDPAITIYNEGSTVLNSVTLSYSVTGGSLQTYTWNGTLNPGASTVANLGTIAIAAFPSTFTCSVTAANGGTDVVAGNNTLTTTLYQIPATIAVAPVAQDFVPTLFPPADWTRINGGGSATWTRSGVGATAANGSAKMDFYNSADGDVDVLYTPKVNLTGLTNPILTFKMAKAPYNTTFLDRMDVDVSTDCGATWTTIWTKTDPALATVAAQTAAFTATSGSTTQWRFETASLSPVAGQTEVLFAFRGISGYGNNLYLDDINIQSTTGIGENATSTSISVFPSITTGDVYINMEGINASDAVVTVLDATGKLVEQFEASKDNSNNIYVNLANRQNGMYFIRVEAEGKSIVNKVVLEN